MTTTTSPRPVAKFVAAAAIIGALTSAAAGVALARNDSHHSPGGSYNNGGDTTGWQKIDPRGYHHQPANQLEQGAIDNNRREYFNKQQPGPNTNYGGGSQTWTRIVHPDGSWSVCPARASYC